MTSIVRQTRYGDTMFVSNPTKLARVIVSWAMAHGHWLCLENLEKGCIRVSIPGVIYMILASEEKNHELSY
jgi:hypothetical protein